ncbi:MULTISPECIES: CPBP family intramembrane glutamic endopeptidase [Methylocaldum]|jgi:membrane protease YdiL (CAAX protease family)|uniref:CPBP family intramembrane glutamic endopeptidase n=1 Tax=unclassified Methylocaldum TaxID=2622260 RepID=UPI00098AD058|nr:CPBP family intramembrane glutamic endopeptidase [Methylocaldum sp. 14B]MDV3241204.1 CPBP family intramembrane metalloprotease [Methylocaldum sp.]MVF23376.1 CPBP family intramembrane metalloprotease [Methylocaldum sp. BRCS4]
MLDQQPPTRYNQFLKIATWFEGGLILLAYVIGWAVSINPLAHIGFSPMALVWGIVGTLPLYLLFALSYNLPWSGMRAVKNFLVEKLGPFLSRYRWQELLYLGFLAGISEEILFRGLLQPWFEQNWGWIGGIAFSNLVFALVHWVTPLYALLAGLTGVYLGIALDFGGERNLVIPILIHAIYDFLAFIAVAQTYRREKSRSF